MSWMYRRSSRKIEQNKKFGERKMTQMKHQTDSNSLMATNIVTDNSNQKKK